MQKYTKYVKICKNNPRHLYKFLLGTLQGIPFCYFYPYPCPYILLPLP